MDSSHPWDKPEYPLVDDAKRTADRGDGDVARVIEARLRDNVVKHPHSRTLKFWPTKLFDYLFQDQDVRYLVEQLVRKESIPVNNHRDTNYWTDMICGHGGDGLVYRRLMAILILVGKPQCIYYCISERISDAKLPYDPDDVVLERLNIDDRELDLFCSYQKQLSVPLFRAPQLKTSFKDNAVFHVDLIEGQVQPWDYLNKTPRQTKSEDYALAVRTADTRSTSTSVTFGGGYGEVHRVIIHPWQHEFQEILKLCYGIVDAVAFIHDPGVLDPSSAGVYGRHGDIKPENVLWFKKRQNSGRMGALVLSDLGLADTHRVQSRSNIPGHAIPTTPNYRPPECDMDGDKGHISRSFDIWTLGCLFLEFLVWALRGWEGRQNFRFDRCKTAYLNGETDVYFDIRRSEGDKADVEFFFEVKEQVTKDEMLIVESDEPPVKRIKGNELRERVRVLKDRCIVSEDYCMEKCTEQARRVSLTRRQENQEPVRAKLNKAAIEALKVGDRLPRLKLAQPSGNSRLAHPYKRSRDQ
ncbi:hypothetical protein SLS53_004369 [Cytospora paraplurivora]|uniref:Protein kinase domain-containing protein n=1 Tax=Cytospora paraplurivora TaxID=2898453 RepID=A0AAN9YHL3_9PEZI